MIYLPKILPYFHISFGINYYLCPFVVIKALCLIPSPVKKTNKQTDKKQTQNQCFAFLGDNDLYLKTFFPLFYFIIGGCGVLLSAFPAAVEKQHMGVQCRDMEPVSGLSPGPPLLSCDPWPCVWGKVGT